MRTLMIAVLGAGLPTPPPRTEGLPASSTTRKPTEPRKSDWRPSLVTLLKEQRHSRLILARNTSRDRRTIQAVPRYLSALFQTGTPAALSDVELLERFAARLGDHDETAEFAFTALLARHGPMVLRVCRAVLGDRHEVEDAFQATFLVLAVRPRSIRRRGSVASWLHGVALRVAASEHSRARGDAGMSGSRPR